jgi:hypothetical protein
MRTCGTVCEKRSVLQTQTVSGTASLKRAAGSDCRPPPRGLQGDVTSSPNCKLHAARRCAAGDTLGKKETNDKFPEGLGFYAQRLAATGARPGLQVNFSAPPGGPAVLRGFTYLKLDLYQIPPGPLQDPKKRRSR